MNKGTIAQQMLGFFLRSDSILWIWTVCVVIWTVCHQFGQYLIESRQYIHLLGIKNRKIDSF